MRWKGIIFLIACTVLFFILGSLFTSRLVENELENLGTTIVGAKVEIDNLAVSLLDARFSWDRLQVTDPGNTMKNMLETGQTDFDLEFIPLLSGKVIVENVLLFNIQTATDRESDGAVPDLETVQKNSFIAGTMNALMNEVSTPVSDNLADMQKNINVDSIMKFLDIESLAKMQQLKSDLSVKFESWQQRLTKTDVTEDARIIEKKLKNLDVNQAK